ncbi:MAG: ABC transporter permease [Clostridiales bacterium]|nr:ABC transporter permease [Clostridiales bacterium]
MVFTDTRTGLFMIVCITIFTGVCNSIQEICKERNILKHEYMTNLNLSAYVVSKLIVQACICAVQMLVVVLIFSIGVSGKLVPDKGVMTSIRIEYYITLFLLTFAADTFALVISSIVKNSYTADTFIPIILIVEFIFSGVLFDTDGFMGIMANLMISKWGIAALASSSGLNNSQNKFLIDNPQTQLQFGSAMSTVEDIYAATTSNLLTNWGILLAFSVVSAILCRVILIGGVKNDRR